MIIEFIGVLVGIYIIEVEIKGNRWINFCRKSVILNSFSGLNILNKLYKIFENRGIIN